MRLLLVEDDPMIRMSVAFGLEDLGFDVIEAATAEEALVLGDITEIDVVVTDIDLGAGLTGIALADRLRAEQPCLPILFVSGGMRALYGRPLGDREAFLAKPFDVDELAALAHRLGQDRHLCQIASAVTDLNGVLLPDCQSRGPVLSFRN